MDLELSFEDFLLYYRSQEFEKGLQNYFKVTKSMDGNRIIRSMDRYFNDSIPEPYSYLPIEKGHEKSHYFAFIFYYMSLCNYAIEKVAGMDALIKFLKCTNWPMTICGMGGILSPNQTLKEADLVYEKNSANCQKTFALFQEVIPFMKEELNNFFKGGAENLNQTAYDEFVKAMDGKIEEFWKIADKEIESFTFHK